MDTGKIILGIACILLSAGMLISPSGAAVNPYSPREQGFQAGYPVPACEDPGYGCTLSTTHPALPGILGNSHAPV